MTVQELVSELEGVTLENIKKHKEYESRWDDFYTMWQRFGPQAARTILIPYIWEGNAPRPSETNYGKRKN